MNKFMKISLRNLYREKLYALINILGLSLAISCFLILALYLRKELSYDQHFENYENIYRVTTELTFNGQTNESSKSSAALGRLIVGEYSEIIDQVGLERSGQEDFLLIHDDDRFYWNRVFWASDNIFNVLKHEVLYGDPETALIEPQSMAVSETFARTYFGNANPIGETVMTGNGGLFAIRLVFADLPENTHLKYDVLLSRNQRNMALPEDVTQLRRMLFNPRGYVYVLMENGFDPQDFQQISESFYERNMRDVPMEGFQSARFEVEPMADIHYGSDKPFDEPKGNISYLYAFAVVAIFVMLVACINYTNLATARYLRRSKEVGLRKILGARQSSLMLQFLGEALLYSFIACGIAIVLVNLILDMQLSSQLLGGDLTFNIFNEPSLSIFLFLLAIGIGLLSGIYPALYLSSWAPLSALVSSGKSVSVGNIRLRQVLVFIQFTISIAVIAITFLISNQMRFISEKELGFDKDNQVAIHLIGADLIEQTELIKNSLLQHPNVLKAATNFELPGFDLTVNAMPVESNAGQLENRAVSLMFVDWDYLNVMGMSFAQGRDFSRDILSDETSAIVVNEAMVRAQGWEEPLGKRIGDRTVIGVVDDFNISSLHTLVEPVAIQLFNDDFAGIPVNFRPFLQRYMTVTIAAENTAETVDYLREQFAMFDPEQPFDFQFIDDTINQQYQAEERLKSLISIFAGFCIFISSLGLFGLASFTTEQRSKEIAIRKVLGANSRQIVMLLSKNALLLVLGGALIASLIAFLGISRWLEDFAYRAPISATAFVGSTLIVASIALLTITLQSWRRAQSDPVHALEEG